MITLGGVGSHVKGQLTNLEPVWVRLCSLCNSREFQCVICTESRKGLSTTREYAVTRPWQMICAIWWRILTSSLIDRYCGTVESLWETVANCWLLSHWCYPTEIRYKRWYLSTPTQSWGGKQITNLCPCWPKPAFVRVSASKRGP